MSQTEKHSFQAEIQQLLEIVIHSLYTEKEIFVRELVSNAADAMEKLRFLQTSAEKIRDDGLPLKISLSTDDQAHTLSITDTGLGMTKEDLIQNLGTIARSGSKEFLQQLAAQKEKSVDLIGQFGVGFYSAFMVAEKVQVFTRSYKPEAEGCIWTSSGAGSYEIEPGDGIDRGTKIVLHLKKEDHEYSNTHRIEAILQKYSSFVPFPLELNGKAVNTVQAIWARNKSEIKEEEYKEFYHYIGHDHEDPRYQLHFNADAPIAIQALLFVPKNNLEKFGMARLQTGVHLYSRKILIQSEAKGLFPEWLRFLKGVVDSEDIPLNVSRETMQDHALLQKMNKVLTGRFIKLLEEESKSNPENFQSFYEEFGGCLKEGTVNDFTHREALSKILRYESSLLDKGKTCTLGDYVSRLGSEQKEIYYLSATNREAAEASPYFEVFRQRKIEVLFFFDPRDEIVMDHLREFDGKKLVSAEKADLSIDDAPKGGLTDDEVNSLAGWMKDQLTGRVSQVKPSRRLVHSPATVRDENPQATVALRRIWKAMQKEGVNSPEEKYLLEINPAHPILVRLNTIRATDEALAKTVTEQLLDGALASAGLLEDSRALLQRMNELIERALKA